MKYRVVLKYALLLGVYLAASFTVLLATALWRGFYNYERIYFSDAIEGTAWRPFVYRRLVPETACIIGSLTPDSVKTKVVQAVLRGMRPHGFLFVGDRSKYQFEYFITVLINILALTAFGLVIQCAIRSVYGSSESACFLTTLASYFGLIPSGTIPLMRQVLQNYRTGEVKVDNVPAPALRSGVVQVVD